VTAEPPRPPSGGRGGQPLERKELKMKVQAKSFPAEGPAGGSRRRALQLALAGLWLLDGALQLQPAMFSRAFADHVLEPAAAENPSWIASPILAIAHLVSSQPLLFDLLFASLQLLIGFGLLWRATVRPALALGILWSLVVWYLGEGLGGVFAGASPLTGAPGAAVLYAFLSLLAWPRDERGPGADPDRPGRSGSRRRLGAVGPRDGARPRWAVGGWVALWASLAWFAAHAGFADLGVAQAGIFESAREAAHAQALAGWVGQATYAGARATGNPGWLAGLDRSWAALSAHHAAAIGVAFTVALALAALAPLARPAAARALFVVAILSALAIWTVGENFGEILTGHGTDPNTGPLLIALTAAFWPGRGRRTGSPGVARQGEGQADRRGERSPAVLEANPLPSRPQPPRPCQRRRSTRFGGS